MRGDLNDPMTKESYIVRWISPSFVPTTMTSRESLSLGSKGRKSICKDALELNTSSLPVVSLCIKKQGPTYDVLPGARTLSFGKLRSMSIWERSRGKSKVSLDLGITLPSNKSSSRVSKGFSDVDDLEVLLRRLHTHAIHVIPVVFLLVEN